jgi:hypothetical protein
MRPGYLFAPIALIIIITLAYMVAPLDRWGDTDKATFALLTLFGLIIETLFFVGFGVH